MSYDIKKYVSFQVSIRLTIEDRWTTQSVNDDGDSKIYFTSQGKNNPGNADQWRRAIRSLGSAPPHVNQGACMYGGDALIFGEFGGGVDPKSSAFRRGRA